ncbi:MAG: thiol peroxidase [Planctomycetota bacterium]|nr:MAG: thiol peroxidase [Planctomycetota bacterium]
MTEIRSGAVTLKGNPVDLAGPELKPGEKAPDFTLQNSKLEDVRLSDFAGKTIVLATVPSLDTPVCAAETKRFNEELAALDGVVSVVASMDLPFAQGRWCQAENVDKVVTLSAHRCTKFGEDYGVLIKGGPLDRCLARAVFVIGPDGTIRYAEYVKEITEHPNYEAILAAAKEAVSA